jgi:dephospho-CoA kinase
VDVAEDKPFFLCITGMPGAGKSTVAGKGVELGFYRIVLGDVVRREVVRAGLEPTDENCGKFMLSIRAREGPDAVAAMAAREIPAGVRRVVVDGVRSLDEVRFFSSLGRTRVLAVHASPARRFELLSKRGRPDDPKTMQELSTRDNRELEIGVGNVIALADEVLVNTRLSKEQLMRAAEEVILGWLREDGG